MDCSTFEKFKNFPEQLLIIFADVYQEREQLISTNRTDNSRKPALQRNKREFREAGGHQGADGKVRCQSSFAIQKHDASNLHYVLNLPGNDDLKSSATRAPIMLCIYKDLPQKFEIARW